VERWCAWSILVSVPTKRPHTGAPTTPGKSLSVAWNELSPGGNNVGIEKEAVMNFRKKPA
jgi:hypothetical protein